MAIFKSLLYYFSSLVTVWTGYVVSIGIFAFYSRRVMQGKIVKDGNLANYQVVMYRIACLLPVAFTAGIRGYAAGADTHGVWLEYVGCMTASLKERLVRDSTAVLYETVQWLICRITSGNVQIFMFLLACVTLYFIISGLEKWNMKHGWLGLFVFYCCFGPQLMNQARQMLAVAILFYAYYYVYNREFRKYLIFTLIAGMIHITAIPVGIAICVLHIRWWTKQKHDLYFVFLGLVCILIPVIIYLLGLILQGTKYYHYAESAKFEPIGFGLILTLLPTMLVTLVLQGDMDEENRMRNTICMTLPARLTAYYAYFVYRVFYFFGIVNIVAFPMALEKAPTKRRKVLYLFLIVCCCLGYFLIFYGWLNASVYFPYVTFVESGIYDHGI